MKYAPYPCKDVEKRQQTPSLGRESLTILLSSKSGVYSKYLCIKHNTQDGINGGLKKESAGPAGENNMELQCFLMSARLTQTTTVKNKPGLQIL